MRAALRDADGDALAGLLRDDASWLAADGTHEGSAAGDCARRVAAEAGTWGDPQVRGAHAVFRRHDGCTLVVEMRGGAVVWVAEAP